MVWTTPRDWVGGEFVTEAIMDTHIRDNLNAIGQHVRKLKTADESVTSSTVLQDDNDLWFPIGASETWVFEMRVVTYGPSAADIKATITGPAGVTGSWGWLYTYSISGVMDIGTVDAFGQEIARGTVEVLGGCQAPIQGYAVNSTTAGNIQFRWAQQASSGTAVIVKAGSWIVAHQIA